MKRAKCLMENIYGLKSSLKSLHIVPWVPLSPNIGGLETYLRWLFSKQVQKGIRIYVIGRTREPISQPIVRTVKEITYFLLPAGRFPKIFPLNIRNLFAILNLFVNTISIFPMIIYLLRKIKPDVVNFYEPYQAPFSLFCRLLGYPTILGHFVFQPHWKPFIPSSNGFSLSFFLWYPVLRCFSVIYTQTRYLLTSKAKIIRNLYLLKRVMGNNRAYFLPGCIDPSAFSKVSPRPEIERLKREGYSVIICPRRLVPEKGVHYLLKAIPRILNNTTRKALFLFTGEGPLLPLLKKEATRLGIIDNVIFTGNIPYKSVLSYIRSSDIVVVPSIGEETLGLAILEAYALKKVVVGTRFGGIPGVIEENHSGLLVQPANSEELADSILKLMNSPQMREELSKHGHELVQGPFNISNTVNKLLFIYCYLKNLVGTY